jgi:pimeloyl-ACP methyl ester carboxylesterase
MWVSVLAIVLLEDQFAVLYKHSGGRLRGQLSTSARPAAGAARAGRFTSVQLSHHRAGSGPPLVLIHGIGSRWQMWEPVLERLQTEHEVLALDLPGFGTSPPPPRGTPAGIGSLTRLVAEFLAEQGVERPHAAGNSLGGWIALELAKQGLVRSATALSPAGFHNLPESVFQRGSLATSYALARVISPVAPWLMRSPLRRRLAFSHLAARPERMSAETAADNTRALAAARWFPETLEAINRERFSGGEAIAVPVTIAWGEHDRLLLRRQSIRALRAIPRARLTLLHGCGHVPTYDDPEQVADVLLQGARTGSAGG